MLSKSDKVTMIMLEEREDPDVTRIFNVIYSGRT